MKKIKTIKTIQIFTTIFIISVIINIVNELLPTNKIITNVAIMLGFASYVLLWVSYGISRQVKINSKRYLILVLLLTCTTIVIGGGIAIWTTLEINKLVQDGMTIIDESTEFIEQIPNYNMVVNISLVITSCLNIIYLGLAGLTLIDNNKLSIEAQKEIDEAYHS
jgi:hypothetical protein